MHEKLPAMFVLVSLSSDEVAKIRKYANEEREAGGILAGERRGSHLRVTGYTTPGPLDTRRRALFVRKCHTHQKTMGNLWTSSGKIIDWIGEWHTHPRASPMPSIIDKRSIEAVSNERQKSMLSWIVGIDQMWFGVHGPKTGLIEYSIVEQDNTGFGLAPI